MALTKQEFSNYIKQFNFRELFNDMGWNNDNSNQPIVLEDVTFLLKAVAEKSGFKILICNPDTNGNIPEYSIRKKIEVKVTKLFQEHLIIFSDKDKKQQIWQLVVRQTGKPTKMTETRYNISQDPELLYQRASGLFFTLDEEEKITIIDVTQRVAENFQQNNERVTKHFYDRFKKEHSSFLSFIEGIDDNVNKDWYASLMLNRLMFCYFIQKKGFLDNNKNYLRDKLKKYQDNKGKNNFFSFYRHFLLTLFHEGLGAPNHNNELKKDIGNIPYLNGGLFDEHELENLYKEIDIEDNAFERIFNFFDEYEWHLDTRISASGKDINPDVIGYIFEKYINDRAQMGAYYTKEDITDYISKNCIIPFLFDETRRNYPQFFAPKKEIWNLLQESGDKYIYDSVKYGINPVDIFGDLPDEIASGLDSNQPNLLQIRSHWNTAAPSEVALPMESWRDVIERRKRYLEIKGKILKGEIETINDFITYNLNICQFTQDVIESVTDKLFIEEFYKSLYSITILDPTCGSGAFLFAAMNILEPIYEGCLHRMECFVNEAPDSENDFFIKELSKINLLHHPNLKYFIFKSIILRNLFGVDIMKEAVEIAKLRLFLKLVATVEINYQKHNLGLEPLPDIDFNIRSGNTLVGIANDNELQKSLTWRLDGQILKPIIESKCNVVAEAFKRYKELQLLDSEDFKQFRQAKEVLKKRLKELNKELNNLLHLQSNTTKLEDWLRAHQPFHWFAEFYEIINTNSGFNVIIGNPPYVEYSKIRKDYIIKGFETEKCANLYPFVIEQSNKLINRNGNVGFIVPLSAFCTQRMEPLVQLYKNKTGNTWISHFGWRPATLFEGVNIPLSIAISNSQIDKSEKRIFVTEFNKWYQEKREHITSLLVYNDVKNLLLQKFVFPKIGIAYNSIFKKILSVKSNIGRYVRNTKHSIYYRNTGGLYWRIILDFEPSFISNGVLSSSSTLTTLNLESEEHVKVFVAMLNSNLFWLYYVGYSSFHHVNPVDLISFPVSFESMDHSIKNELLELSNELMEDMKSNSILQRRIHKGGNNSQSQTFYPSLSKPVVDKIDKVLARYYNFTFEELVLC